MIHVLIVDDHPIVRDGLVAVLEDAPDIRVLATCGDSDSAIAATRLRQPDVVLLDLELPTRGGLAAIPALIAAAPAVKILVFTAYGTDERVLGAVQAGAKGYLLKGATGVEIATGIRAVHAGGSYLEPSVAAKLLGRLRAGPASAATLTDRELVVLRRVADGLPNKSIARDLGVSERTVKYHLTAIMNKLGADNRAQAVALAAQHGLLSRLEG